MPDFVFGCLSSDRLLLRPLRESDLSALCRYRSDPLVARYQSWTTFTEEQGHQLITDQARRQPGVPGTWFQMAIEHKDSGHMIGDCGLHTLRDSPRQAEVGFTLAREHQGKGYATEAVACLFDYVFGKLRLHRAIAVTDARNGPAARVLERLGMRREGHFIENIWFKGAWGDEYLYALLHHEWLRKEPCAGIKLPPHFPGDRV
jgi:RimJ/RimL family protein N-acetyltransferase